MHVECDSSSNQVVSLYSLAASYHTERSVLGSTSLTAAHHFVGRPLVDAVLIYRLHHSNAHNAACHELANHSKIENTFNVKIYVKFFLQKLPFFKFTIL